MWEKERLGGGRESRQNSVVKYNWGGWKKFNSEEVDKSTARKEKSEQEKLKEEKNGKRMKKKEYKMRKNLQD